MSLKLVIREVTIEDVVKGKGKYKIAHVVNEYNGNVQTAKVLSFANPEVFKKVQMLKPGDEVFVTITKNDAGYNQWAKIERADEVKQDNSSPALVPGTGAPAPRPQSQYETREERQFRNLNIVRQSSLSNAIATLAPGAKAALSVDEVLKVAQQYVDFVYDREELDSPDTVDEEIPN